jgi:hypothetical protein
MTDEDRRSALKLSFSGVTIETKPSDHYVDGDWRTILMAPLWIFETIAEADKKSDEKERAAFAQALSEPTTDTFTAFVFTQHREKQDELAKERVRDKRDASRGLGEVAALLHRYPKAEEADAFRTALLSLAERIAQASGGGLFGLGSKVSAQEAAAIERLRALLKTTQASP